MMQFCWLPEILGNQDKNIWSFGVLLCSPKTSFLRKPQEYFMSIFDTLES